MKNALLTVLRGFLLGFGFSVAAVAVIFAAQAYWMHAMSSDARASSSDSINEKVRNSLVLSDVEEQKAEGRVAVIGKITNTGTEAARGVQVEVELFQKGKFVDQYSTYVSGTIAAGESRHFKVACGCTNGPPAEHDDFKVKIRGGY